MKLSKVRQVECQVEVLNSRVGNAVSGTQEVVSGIGIWTQAAGFQSECSLHSLKPDPGGEGGQGDDVV